VISDVKAWSVFEAEFERTRDRFAAVRAVALAAVTSEEERLFCEAEYLRAEKRQRGARRRDPVKPLTDGQILDVREAVAREMGMSVAHLMVGVTTDCVRARWVFAVVLRLAKMSQPQTAIAVGYGDHTSVLSAERRLRTFPDLQAKAERVHCELFGTAINHSAEAA
jgi:hypothetical protein